MFGKSCVCVCGCVSCNNVGTYLHVCLYDLGAELSLLQYVQNTEMWDERLSSYSSLFTSHFFHLSTTRKNRESVVDDITKLVIFHNELNVFYPAG